MKTKIQEVIEEAKKCGEWVDIAPASVNVLFYDDDRFDGVSETQFDLWSRSIEDELEDLWNEFSDENGFSRDCVYAVEYAPTGLTREDYEIVIGDMVCKEILNAAANIDLYVRGDGVDIGKIENDGYDTGVLPLMRDLMITWLYIGGPES